MKLYSCKIRLAGSLHNEVLNKEATAAEITLLRAIHGGNDSVVEVKPVGSKETLPVTDFDEEDEAGKPVVKQVQWTDARERKRLGAKYSPVTSDAGFVGDGDVGVKLVRALFGPDHMPLPQTLDDVDSVDVVEPTARRTRVPRADPLEQVSA